MYQLPRPVLHATQRSMAPQTEPCQRLNTHSLAFSQTRESRYSLQRQPRPMHAAGDNGQGPGAGAGLKTVGSGC